MLRNLDCSVNSAPYTQKAKPLALSMVMPTQLAGQVVHYSGAYIGANAANSG